MKTKLFIAYHKNTHTPQSEILFPIQVGEGADLHACITRDNQGVNISDRNNYYCELTALYWAWKNAQNLEYVGLLHYRRFLDFNHTGFKPNSCGVIEWPAFTTDFESVFGLNQEKINSVISGYDIVLPNKWSVRQAGYKDLNEHYACSPHHRKDDLKRCRNAISKQYPEYLCTWDSVMSRDSAWFNNIFIFKTPILNEYCSWLFPLLETLENTIPLSSYGTQERRVIGYLAERLLNVWITKYLEMNSHARVLQLNRVFINDPSPKVWDPPLHVSANLVVTIVIACDNRYVPHLGALIVSIFANISPSTDVELLILDGGILSQNQALLRKLVPLSSTIKFIPMYNEFTTLFTHMHFSRATFYRLTLEQILKSRDKALYIDCDTIVLGDVRELWDIDMQDKPIAAVHDYIMEHFCRSGILSSDFTGSLPAKQYLNEYVGIDTHDSLEYFQAGVLLMNLKRLRELNFSAFMIKDLTVRKYWFLDQDVLNKYFCGIHLSLPPEWNVINSFDEIRHSLEPDRLNELEQAQWNPKLIHYAGYEAKPWVNPSAKMSSYYFYYLRQSFWYEDVMNLLYPSSSLMKLREFTRKASSVIRKLIRYLWRNLPWRVRRVLNPPAYTLRRMFTG